MKKVTLVEVGLRDGLQNEAMNLSTDIRVEMARQLVAAGIRRLELGAFVRSDRIPQMAGSKEVIEKFSRLHEAKLIQYSALVPNEKGMLDAATTTLKEVAIFTASSESFALKNINCSIDESFERFIPVMKLAKKHKIKVRGYLSTCFGCPYEGPVPEERVVKLAERLYKMGCFEISIGDTIGVATPTHVQSLFKKLKRRIPVGSLCGHFHNTRSTALVNIFAAYNLGITTFDSSIGGLGGCPYAPGSAGNVATEDVAFMFQGMGVKTGLDLEKLVELNHWISKKMGKPLSSKVGLAGLWKPLGAVT